MNEDYPTPWKWEDSLCDGWSLHAANGAIVIGHGSRYGEPTDAPVEPELRNLFLAAPDLLAVLKDVRDAKSEDDLARIMDRVRAVIAKAETVWK